MLNPRVASRYAKSLLDLAIEQNQLEQVYNDMLYMQKLTKASSEFVNLLRSPVVNSDIKRKAVDAVTKGNIGELTKAFTTLLISKARESILPEMINAFITQYKQHKHIQTVKLTTAAPLGDALKKEILEKVKTTGKFEHIELVEEIDPNIIGGFVLQAGDKLIDASIAYDLKTISRQFENNDFIYKVR